MFATSFVVLSVLGFALAFPQHYPRQDFSDQDLFDSCPGGPGSSKFESADRCTLDSPIAGPNVRKFVVVGDPQLNCGGGTEPVTLMVGGSTEVSQTTTVDANVGIAIDGLSIGGGVSDSSTTSSTVSKMISITIPPQRQAVFVGGQNFNSENGRVQVNFRDRQFGHFIWFPGTNITRLTPIDGDVEFDVHESDCGTDPRDLSSYNGQ
ncbi:hypothetical protein TRAPUB_7905 [Trametes pubescens]|uniref:Uncharacterized protein n=1 Tax=Trametes pubescens TaxID=154538 RepID=A0A1M2V270_TRAPU|nr:hypothetical protein TRAPUB_7905 [Trametes pubescens]